jgi:hypothetical protein
MALGRSVKGWVAGTTTLLSIVAATATAEANAAGIFGYSGKTQNRICTQCHGGGTFPDVSIEGPLAVEVGALVTFRIVVKSNAPQNQRFAGFDVGVNAGTLSTITGQGTKLLGGDLTHAQKKMNSSGEAGWDFNWRAPTQPGAYDIFGSGNSVNNDGGQGGDNAVGTVITVDVFAPATPTETVVPSTATPTEAPPTVTATPAPTDTATPVLTNTRRDTPVPTATRTVTPSPTPTATPRPTGPSRADSNCDGMINAADLPATIIQLGAGAIGECGFADGNCSGEMDAGDVEVSLARAFGAAPPPSCLLLP